MVFIKYILFCGLLLSLPIFSAWFISAKKAARAMKNRFSDFKNINKKAVAANTYILIKDTLAEEKTKLALAYKNAVTLTEKREILAKAEKLLPQA